MASTNKNCVTGKGGDSAHIDPDPRGSAEMALGLVDAVMPIAVVGIGFRGPGDAHTTEKLWKMILEGREAWSSVPKEKWNNEAFYHPDSNRNGTVCLLMSRNGYN